MNNLRSRDALDFLQRHHQRLPHRGPLGGARGIDPSNSSWVENALDQLWNDFHSAFQPTVPDEEEELTRVLADAIGAATPELPDGFQFGCERDRRYLEVETHRPDSGVDKLLVGVCNASTRGIPFGKQIAELEKRAGEIPVAIVRTTNFPKSGKAATQIATMLRRHGRTVVVADSDWRRMLAFEAFRKQHATTAGLRRVAEGRPAAR